MAATHRKVACCILAAFLLVFILSAVHLNSDPGSDDELGLLLQFKKAGTKKVTQDSEEGERERRNLQSNGDDKQERRATTEAWEKTVNKILMSFYIYYCNLRITR
ncbi:hypothetical protein Bbelb_368230 [Branchiostoma belcheri]|nr:hypothetical protein Bbelb_368230 [Branchiostoma belcheri]